MMILRKILSKIKATILGIIGVYFLSLWFFGGIIGAIVAAFNGHLFHLLFSLLLPAYGAIYTIIMTLAAIF